jgi:hypothetical protein
MTRMNSQPNTFLRGVLWDADGVLQRVSDASWELAWESCSNWPER